ncbi:hypothetical protein BT63DRAFT_438807 [Microthyrium microscopicum]|uniref:Uncharacterized protein n=1 Tax=Microthyrium microscopicum TaxID=703497 RepID=A0A6A6UGM1_9PEZI|nr:hypothetical protein BT63DRAFT_438807 [Microthyrium microscopicum]
MPTSKFLQEGDEGSKSRVARVVWAAHILSYLTKTRSHSELQQPDTTEEGEGLQCGELDAYTERAVILQGSRESIRSKFLDCIAQLLSPKAGRVSPRQRCVNGKILPTYTLREMTALGIEIEYCKKLKEYLSNEVHKHSSPDFECMAIAYTGRRVDNWVETLRNLLKSVLNRQKWSTKRWSGSQQAFTTWLNFIELLHQKDIGAASFREKVVQQAYECVSSVDVQQLLNSNFEAKVGEKLWYALKFLARPIIDCRILWHIASLQSQFRDIRISPVSSSPRTTISPAYQIHIQDAWAQLFYNSPSEAHLRSLAAFSERFQKKCAKSYRLHAETQLVMHFENPATPTPTIPYFECSKKACLLCNGFLQSLPQPITTRGSHSICYPAWGVPSSGSLRTRAALAKLEKRLLSRINTYLDTPIQARNKLFVEAVPQSSLVSDLSSLALQDSLERQEKTILARNTEIARREERLILLLCKDFSTQTTRPSPSHKRAILFPAGNVKPRMIWIPCELRREYGTAASYENISPHPYLGADEPFVGTKRIESNPIRDRNLGCGFVYFAPRKKGYAVSLMFRNCFLDDGSALNKSLLKAVGTSGTIPHRWCGPVVAVREQSNESYEDITLGDFRHILDWMISYRLSDNLKESDSQLISRPSAGIRGVKICCYGETKLHGSEAYVLVDVPRAHPTRLTYRKGSVSPISRLLGLPLILWKYTDIEQWIHPAGWDDNMTADSNQDATFLMVETDPEKADWGWAPLDWNLELGNVLAVRLDGKDLAIDDVRLMSLDSYSN